MKPIAAPDRSPSRRPTPLRRSPAFLVATGLSGIGLSFGGIAVSVILALMEAPDWVLASFHTALGVFLGLVSWSATVGGLAPYVIPLDPALYVSPLPGLFVAIGGGIGILLRRELMARRRNP